MFQINPIHDIDCTYNIACLAGGSMEWHWHGCMNLSQPIYQRHTTVPFYAFGKKLYNYPGCRKYKDIIYLPRRKVKIEKISDIGR
jgi:hypothetical protein